MNNPRNLALFQATPHTNEKTKETTESQTETKPGDEEGMESMHGKIYNVLFEDKAAVWTAIFTCVLAVFSYLLWDVSKEANNTSTATQAASVSSVGPFITKVPSDDGKKLKGYNVVFTWANSGTTPTRAVVMQSNITIGSQVPSKELDFNKLQQSKSLTAVLGPKAGLQTPANYVALEDIEHVVQGKTHMFFWGWAVYKDIFSETPRLSEYCYDIQGAVWTKPDHADPATDMTLDNPPCGVHFCFNEECEDYKARTK